MGTRQCDNAGRLILGAGRNRRGEAGRTPHTSGLSMHDAPPPPLDRQGIGRLLAGPLGAPTPHSTTDASGGYAAARTCFNRRDLGVVVALMRPSSAFVPTTTPRSRGGAQARCGDVPAGRREAYGSLVCDLRHPIPDLGLVVALMGLCMPFVPTTTPRSRGK